jgi:hypothetical protein
MEVVETGVYGWYLLRNQADWVLDVLCSHSFVDYRFIMRMNASEIEAYQSGGAGYLDRLAHDIHYSAPGVLGSSSVFIPRNATAELKEIVDEAIVRYTKRARGNQAS